MTYENFCLGRTWHNNLCDVLPNEFDIPCMGWTYPNPNGSQFRLYIKYSKGLFDMDNAGSAKTLEKAEELLYKWEG